MKVQAGIGVPRSRFSWPRSRWVVIETARVVKVESEIE